MVADPKVCPHSQQSQPRERNGRKRSRYESIRGRSEVRRENKNYQSRCLLLSPSLLGRGALSYEHISFQTSVNIFTVRRSRHMRDPGALRSQSCTAKRRPQPESSEIVFQRDPTNSGTPDSSSNSWSDRRSEAAATFCSRCSTEDVPGIGNMIGDRRNSQARAMCVGLALCAFAIRLRTSPATLPAPSGNQGMKAIRLRWQYSTTKSHSRSAKL